MIKYIKEINAERRRLRKGHRIICETLNMVSLAVGCFLLIEVSKLCFWQVACEYVQTHNIVFWSAFPFAFFLFIFVGQLIINGSYCTIMVLSGKLTAKEAVRYTVLSRAPITWRNPNA